MKIFMLILYVDVHVPLWKKYIEVISFISLDLGLTAQKIESQLFLNENKHVSSKVLCWEGQVIIHNL